MKAPLRAEVDVLTDSDVLAPTEDLRCCIPISPQRGLDLGLRALVAREGAIAIIRTVADGST
jgi:hypothetical protein